MSISPFARKLTDTALKQHTKYHLMREQHSDLTAQIKQYWQGIAPFPGVSTAWSAVFISWCVRQAGATAAEFHFAAAHSQFVFEAIQNHINQTGVFRGRKLTEYAPKVGDILHNNRSEHSFDYNFARQHRSYESHSAIIIEVGIDNVGHYLRTIGGNEGDTVGMKEVRLNNQGLVKNPSGLYISIIETLK